VGYGVQHNLKAPQNYDKLLSTNMHTTHKSYRGDDIKFRSGDGAVVGDDEGGDEDAPPTLKRFWLK
jgi:hypothetical protein